MMSGCWLGRLMPVVLIAGAGLGYAQSNPMVLSAAGGAPAVAPAGLATVYGLQLVTSPMVAQVDSNNAFPTVLGGYSVTVNGEAAAMLYVSPSQINFIVPADAQPGNGVFTVMSSASQAAQARATIQLEAPAIFTYFQGTTLVGAILNAVTFTAAPFSPDTTANYNCDKRTRLAVYATGLGLAERRLQLTDIQVQLTDSSGAAQTLPADSAASAAGFSGLDQVNVALPINIAPGAAKLQLVVQGNPSNWVTFQVMPRTTAMPATACLDGVSLTMGSGGQAVGAARLVYPVTSGPVTVSLTSATAAVPATVVFPAGTIAEPFTVNTSGQTAGSIQVTAGLNGDSKTAMLDLSTVCVSAFSVSSASVPGGQNLTATVSLASGAPSGGLMVTVLSSDSNVQTPGQVTVASGQSSATIPLTTTTVTTSDPVTLTATSGSCSAVPAALTLVPGGPSSSTGPVTPVNQVTLSRVVLEANMVQSGQSLGGTVVLSGPAPAGGALVTLTSSDPMVSVPMNVLVMSGQTVAQFPVSVGALNAGATVIITATYGASTQNAGLVIQATQ